MLIRKVPIALAGVLASTLLLAPAFAAGLKDKPPSGVKLSGSWRLDPQRSDDPREVMAKAAKAEQQRRDNPDRDVDRGGVFDRDCGMDPTGRDPTTRDPTGRDPFGRECRDPWARRGGDRSPFPDDTYRRDRGGNSSSTIDPTGGGGSITWGTGNGVPGINNEWLLQLDPSPDRLTILDNGTHVSVSENKLETACGAGKTEPVSDSFGDGERKCGWKGKAWVIETTRGKRFKRVDQFELVKNGAVLNYTTSASGQNMPPVRIFRTYELIPAGSTP